MKAQADEDRVTQLLEEIATNTREIATWLDIAYGSEFRMKLEALLDDDRKRAAYEYSTGRNSSRVVARVAGVSDRAIRDWWREWMERGIVEPGAVEGRFQRRLSLRRLGMGVPSGVAVNDAKEGD